MAVSPRNFVAGVLPIWMAAAGATLLALEKAADFAMLLPFLVVFFIFTSAPCLIYRVTGPFVHMVPCQVARRCQPRD